MGYLGLWIYLFLSIIQPAAWWPPLAGAPLEKFLFPLLLLLLLLPKRMAVARKVASLPHTWAILFCFATHLTSFVVSGVFWFGGFAAIAAAFFRFLCIYGVFAVFADTRNKIKWVLFYFVFLSGVVAVQCIDMKITGVGWAGQDMYWGERVRWVGMYDGANVLCMLFVLAMAFALHLVWGPWGTAARVLALSFAPLLVWGIYLTNSRGGFLAFLVVIVSFFFLRGRSLQRIGVGKISIAATACLLLLVFGPSRLDAIKDAERSTMGRIDAWYEGLQLLKQNPLFGVGQGEWDEHLDILGHNSLVQTMGETGFVGLFAWIAMLYVFVATLLAIVKNPPDPEIKSLASALLTAFAGLLAASFFITTTQFDLFYVFFGLTTGCILLTGESFRFDRRDFLRIGAIAVFGVILIHLTVRVF